MNKLIFKVKDEVKDSNTNLLGLGLLVHTDKGG